MHIDEWGVDFRRMEEPKFPYHPDPADINKIGHSSSLTVIPLQAVDLSLLGFVKLAIRDIFLKFSRNDELQYLHSSNIPASVKENGKPDVKRFLKLSVRPYRTHLKIGSQSLDFMKESLKLVLRQFKSCEGAYIPILVECHTKQCRGNMNNISAFFDYMKKHHNHEIEFGTASELSQKLQRGEFFVRSL